MNAFCSMKLDSAREEGKLCVPHAKQINEPSGAPLSPICIYIDVLLPFPRPCHKIRPSQILTPPARRQAITLMLSHVSITTTTA